MRIEAIIVAGPLKPADAWTIMGMGALVCFEGVVRPVEGGEPIDGLWYEDYAPMAVQELERLACAAVLQYGLLGISAEHSRGFVAVGNCSFRLRIVTEHREPALSAMSWYIDQMKQEVPIWKKAVRHSTLKQG
ncbi:MAG: hypothetical protein HJJLKODD_02695 [Phycisphaerae bacterium]|nr:hypothetical protein [Phycisphaerae bacterium]